MFFSFIYRTNTRILDNQHVGVSRGYGDSFPNLCEAIESNGLLRWSQTIVDKNTGSLWNLIPLANMRIPSCGALIMIRTRVAVSVDLPSGEVPLFSVVKSIEFKSFRKQVPWMFLLK